MKCNKCGREFQDEQRCPGCGFPAGALFNVQNLQNLSNGQALVQPQKKKVKAWMVILIVVGVLIVIAGIGGLFGGNSSKKVNANANQANVSQTEDGSATIPDDVIRIDYLSVYADPDKYIDKYVQFSCKIYTLTENEKITIDEGLSGINLITVKLKDTTSCKKDDYVTIAGRVDSALFGNVYIEDAFVVSTGAKAKENYDSEMNAKVENEKKEKQETKAAFIESCKEYAYKDIARKPKDYQGKPAKFRGKVLQVLEREDKVVFRIDVTHKENKIYEKGFWSDTVYVEYTPLDENESRILEDDIVNMYGTLDGLKTYKTVLGSETSIPKLKAKYIEIE